MVDTNVTFGFELLQRLSDAQITKKEDVIILFVHWYFIKCGFRCLGIGDSKAFEPSEKGSELLPAEWSSQPNNYALRYIKDGKLYIFHGIKSDEDLLLNLLNVEDLTVSNIQFPVNQTVQNLHGSLESLIPSYQSILNTIQKDLIQSIVANNTIEISTQTETSRDIPIDTRTVGPSRPCPATHPWNPLADPRNVGNADLFPNARGGGMIFDPFSTSVRNPLEPRNPGLGVPGRLPPGAIPPYARFDPFGPPDVNPRRPRNPDPDNLPPPGYDDMFM